LGLSKMQMSIMLSDREWKGFLLSGDDGIFQNYHGKRLTKDDRKEGDIPLLTAGEQRQGVAEFVSNLSMEVFEDFISIDMFGNSFYHKHKCCGDDNIYFFINDDLSEYVKLFITNSIGYQKDKYSYGKQFRQKNADSSKILLPVNPNNSDEPDYDLMEQYIKSIIGRKVEFYKQYTKTMLSKLEYKEIQKLEEMEWDGFEVGKLFKFQTGKSKGLNHLEKTINGINYLGATNRNNGVLCQVKNNEEMIQKGNCIAFIRNGEGSMGYAVYKSEDFIATSDITAGYADFLNRHIGLFITTVSDKIRGKYNFGYKRSDTRLKKEKLLLPVNDKGELDYEFMEQYMKNLEYKKIKLYLDFLENQNR